MVKTSIGTRSAINGLRFWDDLVKREPHWWCKGEMRDLRIFKNGEDTGDGDTVENIDIWEALEEENKT